MKTTLIWIATLLCLHTATAQSGPYSMFGHEGKVLDLSDVVGEGLKITAADSQAVYAKMNPRLHLFSILDGTGAMIRQDSISLAGYARWMSVDPARQFASPYVGMGNNPVSGVDPDGRYSEKGAAWRNFLFGDGSAIYQSGGEWGYNTTNGDATIFNFGRTDQNTFRSILDKQASSTLDHQFQYNELFRAQQGLSNGIEATNIEFEAVLAITTLGIGNGGLQAVKASTKLPTQMHHFATNKNKIFTPKMKKIADEFGLDLDGAWNKQALPHLGRHPNSYHNFVLKGMRDAKAGAAGSQTEFLNVFNQSVKQPVILNPGLLRKSGW